MPYTVRPLSFLLFSGLIFYIDTEGKDGPVDPLAALEKSTEAQNYVNQVQVPRIESLQTLSDHYGSDPYNLSRKVRKRFREDKKVEKEKEAADDRVKGRYGLPETLTLVEETEESKADARAEWVRQKEISNKRRRVMDTPPITGSSSVRPASSKSISAVSSLRTRILQNTARVTSTGPKSSKQRSGVLK